MNLGDVITEIEHLEHVRSFDCLACGTLVWHHVLEIYANCPGCQKQFKVRAFGGVGTEIQDVIDAVLSWIERDESPEGVVKRSVQVKQDEGANGGSAG